MALVISILTSVVDLSLRAPVNTLCTTNDVYQKKDNECDQRELIRKTDMI